MTHKETSRELDYLYSKLNNFLIVEFLNDQNCWEWYAVRKNTTPQQAIMDYLMDMELLDDDCTVEDIAFNVNGQEVYAKEHDVRAYPIEIT